MIRRLVLCTVAALAWDLPVAAEEHYLDPEATYRVPAGDAPFRGPSAAKVTLVEFSDFQCPFCVKVNATLAELRRRYHDDLKIVYRHMPLPFHDEAMLAAEASMAAAAQGKFWELHDALFADPRNVGREGILELARRLQLDEGRFRKELDGGTYKKRVLDDVALAERLGASGTPTFFVNGRPMVGAQSVDSFVAAIERERERAGQLLARGVALDKIYDEATRGGRTEGATQPPRRSTGPDPTAVHAVPVNGSPALGAATAKLTIVELGDFQCPFCARVEEALSRVRAEYGGDVRLVYKHLPLPFHDHAEDAARAAVAAGEQGKFWPMHDLLLANQDSLAPGDLDRYAQQIGLDVDRFHAALDSAGTTAALRADAELAERLGVRGTPTFFINGQLLAGAQPFESFQAMLEAQRQRADELLAEGVPPEALYDVAVGLAEADPARWTVAACRAKDAARARRAFAKVTGEGRPRVRGECRTLGVKLPK